MERSGSQGRYFVVLNICPREFFVDFFQYLCLICHLFIGLYNPLSPKNDQHQIFPCNINAFVKQGGHENYRHDCTR